MGCHGSRVERKVARVQARGYLTQPGETERPPASFL